MIVAIALSLLAVGLLLAVLRMVVLPAGETRMRLRVPFILLLTLGAAGVPLISIAFQSSFASAGSALRRATASVLGDASPAEFGDDRPESSASAMLGALTDGPFAGEVDASLRDWFGVDLFDGFSMPVDGFRFRFLGRPFRPAAQLFVAPLAEISTVAALADPATTGRGPLDLIGSFPPFASNGGGGGGSGGVPGGGLGGIGAPPLSGSPGLPPVDPGSGAGGNPPDGGTAVPEPGTWLVMVVGFAMLGLTLRRRRSVGPQAIA